MEVMEPAVSYQKQHYTIEEYLELEKYAEEKHEYYCGEIFAMSGPKLQHNLVVKNVKGHLWNMLRGNPCQPYGGNQRIHIPKNTFFTYPDIVIVCGTPETLDNNDDNLLNPTVIIEVISATTRVYEKTTKFNLYKDIPTLKEYILIEPEELHIEANYLNKSMTWETVIYSGLKESLYLSSLGIYLPLAYIYEGAKVVNKE